MSIHTMSEVDDADDEDDDEDISSGRQSRIEQLAKKIMEEEASLKQYESRHRHNSDPEQNKRDPINLNAELDTVSERSEIEELELNGGLDHASIRQGENNAQWEILAIFGS